jgi:hypothetical protein
MARSLRVAGSPGAMNSVDRGCSSGMDGSPGMMQSFVSL